RGGARGPNKEYKAQREKWSNGGTASRRGACDAATSPSEHGASRDASTRASRSLTMTPIKCGNGGLADSRDASTRASRSLSMTPIKCGNGGLADGRDASTRASHSLSMTPIKCGNGGLADSAER